MVVTLSIVLLGVVSNLLLFNILCVCMCVCAVCDMEIREGERGGLTLVLLVLSLVVLLTLLVPVVWTMLLFVVPVVD